MEQLQQELVETKWELEQQYAMQKGMEIRYHNWRATCILAASREVQFESKLLQLGVDFQKDKVFQVQGLRS
jgi:hypothetical protein